MELPTPNIPLLRKAVEWAEVEAAKTDGTGLWNQSHYKEETACGTAYCIAGYVVSSHPGYGGGDTILAILDGLLDQWDDHAARLLGITLDEADDLFIGSNDITDIREIAEQIAARAGERL